jgi:hypothetical protein
MSTPEDKSIKPGRSLRSRLSPIRKGLQRAAGNELPKWQVWGLRLTLVVDGLAAIALAFLEFDLDTAVASALGVGIFLAIGFVNLWALYSLVRAAPSWPRDVAIAQAFVALLALYIVFMVARSFGPKWWTLAITAAVGVLAIGWILRVWRGAASVHWTKTAAIITALFPLAGLAQFWLQTEYIPKLTTPMFDISADLSPTGRTGSTIHLSAKVTFHNRGSVILDMPAGLMRVTAYPKIAQQSQSTCSTEPATGRWPNLLGAMDPTGSETDAEFRMDPTPVAQCALLYATFLGGPGAFLNPGGTVTMQKEIDIDSNTIRLARLTVSGVFVTERRFEDVRACWPTKDTNESVNPKHWPIQASLYKDPDNFYQEAGHLWPGPGPAINENLCVDYEFAPRNVVQELESGPPILRVEIITGRWWDSFNEYPQLNWWYGAAADIDKSFQKNSETEKILRSNPASGMQDVTAEYAPDDSTAPSCHG